MPRDSSAGQRPQRLGSPWSPAGSDSNAADQLNLLISPTDAIYSRAALSHRNAIFRVNDPFLHHFSKCRDSRLASILFNVFDIYQGTT
ncbi:unnamed protein product [Bubo scandiacus]